MLIRSAAVSAGLTVLPVSSGPVVACGDGPMKCLDLLFCEPRQLSAETSPGPGLHFGPVKTFTELRVRTRKTKQSPSGLVTQKRGTRQSWVTDNWGQLLQVSHCPRLSSPPSGPLRGSSSGGENITFWGKQHGQNSEACLQAIVFSGVQRKRLQLPTWKALARKDLAPLVTSCLLVLTVPQTRCWALCEQSPFIPQQSEEDALTVSSRGRWDLLGISLGVTVTECWVSIPQCLTLWLWRSSIPALNLSFLICKMGIRLPNS